MLLNYVFGRTILVILLIISNFATKLTCTMGLLRLFFALSVVLGHIQINLLISPTYAVQGFYIISGFYMSMILNEKYNTPLLNTTFYKRRFMRLLPTYWLIGIISFIIALCFYHRNESNILFFDFINFPTNSSLLTWLFLIFSNIFIWGQDLALFLVISPENGSLNFSALSFGETYPALRYMLIPVAWSVSTEFTFYIIAPYVLRNKQKIVLVLFIISILSNIFTNYYGLNNSNWRFRFFPSVLLFFLTGYYAYLIYRKYLQYHISLHNKHLIIISVLSLMTIILNYDISFSFNVFILLVFGVIMIPLLFASFKNEKIDRIIGEMSYPLYLIHPIMIGIDELTGLHSKLFIVIASLVGAFCCYHFYICPLEKMRYRIN